MNKKKYNICFSTMEVNDVLELKMDFIPSCTLTASCLPSCSRWIPASRQKMAPAAIPVHSSVRIHSRVDYICELMYGIVNGGIGGDFGHSFDQFDCSGMYLIHLATQPTDMTQP